MDDTGWLIEVGSAPPRWWDGHDVDSFTSDASAAVRFARKTDAEAVLYWGKVCLPPPGEVRITEHAWIGKGEAPK
jgi:hypothetical protein